MKNADLISVSVLIDKYVTVHLNKNDPNKKKHTYSAKLQDNFEKKKKKKMERNTSSCHTKWTPGHKYTQTSKKQQIKKRYAHNTKMSLETMIVVG